MLFEAQATEAQPENFRLHIIGAGRGGTSLLAGLFDSHPDCEIAFETHSMSDLMGLSDPVVTAPSSLRERTASRIDRFIRACEGGAAGHPGKIWGHKTTTEQIAGLALPQLDSDDGFDPVDHFIARLSSVPTLFILRDGRTCVDSKVRRTGQPIQTAIDRWKFSIRYLQGLRASSTPLCVLKMEDLIAHPVSVLTDACNSIGLAFDPAMLEGTMNNKMRPEYRRSTLDPGAGQNLDPRPTWLAQIEAELVYCGYLG